MARPGRRACAARAGGEGRSLEQTGVEAVAVGRDVDRPAADVGGPRGQEKHLGVRSLALVQAAVRRRQDDGAHAGRDRCARGAGPSGRLADPIGTASRPVRHPHRLSRTPRTAGAARSAVRAREGASPRAALWLPAQPERGGRERLRSGQRPGARVCGARHLVVSRRLSPGADRGSRCSHCPARDRLAHAAELHREGLRRLSGERCRSDRGLLHRWQRAQQPAVPGGDLRHSGQAGLPPDRQAARLYRSAARSGGLPHGARHAGVSADASRRRCPICRAHNR